MTSESDLTFNLFRSRVRIWFPENKRVILFIGLNRNLLIQIYLAVEWYHYDAFSFAGKMAHKEGLASTCRCDHLYAFVSINRLYNFISIVE